MLRQIVYITLFITAFILLWILFSIKHNLDSSTITPQTNANIVPITPTFDTNTLRQLQSRTVIPVDLNSSAPSGIVVSSASATPTVTPTSKVSPSPEITPDLSASTSAK